MKYEIYNKTREFRRICSKQFKIVRMRKAKIKEIKILYKFNPAIKIWLCKMTDKNKKTEYTKLPEETWYGGYWFNSGCFISVKLKYTVVNIIITWWKIKFK